MHKDYYGLLISTLSFRHRWKWQIILPYGGHLTSNNDYSTPEEALLGGKSWIDSETAFNALNSCLAQFYSSGLINPPEYQNLMDSLRGITQRC
ncbi:MULTISPECIES: hypothetical protein [Arthrospira]|jgi:hypothetical protein|uniref:Uncharacterized protein n=1 Tax=Limnospira platensis NIES-46 TaxID=1236695 RepID=A0A5M3T9X4_LIMPL|nr:MULTISPECIES: hypothetical protein [Arthrospira]AMW31137.1 hypothetical protein AP285_27690 [Arthrospira platensis YZ]KDR54879.1 hypothetical protein APPUASWS_025460 [Arthrospira platensis str. Paraca]MBD2671043.1 hypothetical protein [Arthrospira platensis FACHB-439]MBD2711864.1 hypothetical protein [Arthrospira platensis FACHB-835]MDF2208553.1 hypothetical protein [Arthrospira platensis NCB002]MDT9184469.1 hypothetical protein [Limnospira sp. PMC 289.06]MDT9296628.1 hypothetical protein